MRKAKQVQLHPMAGILPRDHKRQGIEIQTYSYAGNEGVHCGVHWVPEISARWLYRLESHWLRWRKWYNRQTQRKEALPVVTMTVGFPIDNPEQQTVLHL